MPRPTLPAAVLRLEWPWPDIDLVVTAGACCDLLALLRNTDVVAGWAIGGLFGTGQVVDAGGRPVPSRRPGWPMPLIAIRRPLAAGEARLVMLHVQLEPDEMADLPAGRYTVIGQFGDLTTEQPRPLSITT